MNWKRGFRRITLVLAILAAVICGVFAGSLPIDKYRVAKRHRWLGDRVSVRLNEIGTTTEQELQKFETWQEARFWRDLSKVGLVARVVLYGLGAATIGYCIIWLICYLIEWLILGFAVERPTTEQNNK